jgi:hypothetical protein
MALLIYRIFMQLRNYRVIHHIINATIIRFANQIHYLTMYYPRRASVHFH